MIDSSAPRKREGRNFLQFTKIGLQGKHNFLILRTSLSPDSSLDNTLGSEIQLTVFKYCGAKSVTFLVQIFLHNVALSWGRRGILGYNATVLRVTLEKMLSECLQNCPRNVDCAAVEFRGQFWRHEDGIFSRVTRRMWHYNIITRFCKFCSFLIGIQLNVLKIASRGIMTVLKSIIIRFTNKPYDYDSTEIHNHTVY